VLELPESGRHDEVLKSVVAHNARRRVQRRRAERNRRLAHIGGKLGVLAACGLGAYLLVTVASSLFGGGGSGSQTAAATPPPAKTSAPPASTPSLLGGGLSLPAVTPKATTKHATAPKHVRHRTVKTKTKAKAPVTATIASIPATHHTATAKTKKKPTPTHHAATPSVQKQVVLAEADASQGTRTTQLEATIPAPGVATFTVAATRGSSFVEVRLKSASGALLTKGTVPKGETITFSNKALWVKVYAPGRLDLSVNGKPWRPIGSTVVATLTPTGVS
jgi:hypothetical protein